MLPQILVTAAAVGVASAVAIEPRAMSIKAMFPPSRPENSESSHRGPCGGAVAGERVDFPLTGGKISVAGSAAIDNLNFLYGQEKSATDYLFKTYGEKTVVDMSAGHYCAAGPDFSSLGYKAGDEATILIMYQADGPPRRGTDKRWQHICADVKLVESSAWAQPSGFMCANAGDEIRIAETDEIMNFTVSADSAAGNSKGRTANQDAAANADKFTDAEAGGIGAGVTAGVFLLAGAAAWAAGLLSFGKKNKRSPYAHDDASSVGSTTKQVPRA